MVEYADFEFYTKEFHGSTIPDTVFPSAMLRSSIFIRYITFDRIDETDIPEEAKLAACAVADLMYKDDQARDETGREKKSFKNILCYCSTLPPFNISREQRYLKTSYVIVQPKAKWSNK